MTSSMKSEYQWIKLRRLTVILKVVIVLMTIATFV